jgi:hypothetical protein
MRKRVRKIRAGVRASRRMRTAATHPHASRRIAAHSSCGAYVFASRRDAPEHEGRYNKRGNGKESPARSLP